MLITLVLVVGVIFAFLHSGSATLIPALALPFFILGTFAAMAVLGFTIVSMTVSLAVVFIPILFMSGSSTACSARTNGASDSSAAPAVSGIPRVRQPAAGDSDRRHMGNSSYALTVQSADTSILYSWATRLNASTIETAL